MARISKFISETEDDKDGTKGIKKNKLHDVIKCVYSVFTVDGVKVLQLNTYGRESREMPDKISQTIQLDKASGRELKRLLDQEFPE